METNFKPNYTIHPGVFLREEMEALKISQKALAEKIGVAKTIINEVINGKRKLSADLAVRLEQALYSPASYWINLQALYDEAEARIRLNKSLTEETGKDLSNNYQVATYSQHSVYNYYNFNMRCIA